jgi:hypothetical protein
MVRLRFGKTGPGQVTGIPLRSLAMSGRMGRRAGTAAGHLRWCAGRDPACGADAAWAAAGALHVAARAVDSAALRRAAYLAMYDGVIRTSGMAASGASA